MKEYLVKQCPRGLSSNAERLADKMTELMNQYAGDGWRVITVNAAPSLSAYLITFERDK